jgi:CUB domain.
LNIPSFKTESSKDVLELRDGQSGNLLYVLSGVLRSPLQITSPSNMMDVRFVTNGNVTLDGFEADYFASRESFFFVLNELKFEPLKYFDRISFILCHCPQLFPILFTINP